MNGLVSHKDRKKISYPVNPFRTALVKEPETARNTRPNEFCLTGLALKNLLPMKRIVLAFAAAIGLFTTTSTFAQVQFGVRGGAHWGTVSKPAILDNYSPSFQLSPGPQGALFLDIPVSERVSFRPELGYSQKGLVLRESFSFDVLGVPVPLGARIALQTRNIDLPLLAKINLASTESSVQPYLIAGPAVSYAADSRVRARAEGLFRTQPFDLNVPLGGVMNRWDVSGVGGLGLAFNAGAGQFVLEGRYVHGLTRQIEVPVVQLPVRNRGVSVSLGYSFPIGQ